MGPGAYSAGPTLPIHGDTDRGGGFDGQAQTGLPKHERGALARRRDTADGTSSWWPEPHDTDAARTWISEVWAQPAFSAAIRQASSALAARLDAVCDGQPVPPRQIRRAYLSTAAYVLRATGRPTPFGLFAGIAPARIGSEPQLRWGDAHRAVVRADTEWLEDIVGSLEAVPELRERLRVVVSSWPCHAAVACTSSTAGPTVQPFGAAPSSA